VEHLKIDLATSSSGEFLLRLFLIGRSEDEETGRVSTNHQTRFFATVPGYLLFFGFLYFPVSLF